MMGLRLLRRLRNLQFLNLPGLPDAFIYLCVRMTLWLLRVLRNLEGLNIPELPEIINMDGLQSCETSELRRHPRNCYFWCTKGSVIVCEP